MNDDINLASISIPFHEACSFKTNPYYWYYTLDFFPQVHYIDHPLQLKDSIVGYRPSSLLLE